MMPTVEENQATWGEAYEWPDGGDEWSTAWGGVDSQWYSTLYPRIRPFVPTGVILEIAPGFGRWTQFLVDQCDSYIGVDIVEKCIDHCRQRFAAISKATFYVNDGTSLEMVPDGSVDFCFSFDSLVHAEADVVSGYLQALATKLAPDGVAFIHHSNLGERKDQGSQALRRFRPSTIADHVRQWINCHPRLLVATPALRRRLHESGRAATVSAQGFVALADNAGLACIGQEIINWGGVRLIDCISMVVRPGSVWDRENIVVRNRDFMRHVASVARSAQVFSIASGLDSG
jgi:hypothetical protein